MSFSQKIKEFFSKVWAYLRIAKVEWIIVAAALFLDLLSKGLVQANMNEGETIVLIPQFLEFCFVYNDKAAFSFDFGLSNLIGTQGTIAVFIVITFLAVGAFCFVLYRLRGGSLLGRIALALIIGGALGNMYDRMFVGKVRDFIQIVYFGAEINLPEPFDFLNGSSFAIFNVADMCLCVGVAACIVYIFKYGFKDDHATENKECDDQNMQPVCDMETDSQAENCDLGQDETLAVTQRTDGQKPDEKEEEV